MIVKNLFEYKQQKCKMLRCYVLNDVFMIIMYHFMVLYLVFLSMCDTESMGEKVDWREWGICVAFLSLCVTESQCFV